ncbi:MAG: D-alanyl-D-alanine carboxypeptidase family protein [bacterium]
MKQLLTSILVCVLAATTGFSATSSKKTTSKKSSSAKEATSDAPKKAKGCISKDPYIGAIVIDADTGAVIFEQNADAICYPASTLKMMTLLVIEEKIADGSIKLSDPVKVSLKACKTGGTQVWLDPKETFSVQDLLYALMIRSANDAAVALAEHVSGTTEAFCELMNARAKTLGMTNSHFITPNGLTTSADKEHDRSTARDMATIGRALCKHPDIFAYTSTIERKFREGSEHEVVMTTHNPFLKDKVDGCDGFKTGYTGIAGWSIIVTCKRDNRRVILAVMGSEGRLTRDAKAKELLNKAFAGTPAPSVPKNGKISSAKSPPPPPQ